MTARTRTFQYFLFNIDTNMILLHKIISLFSFEQDLGQNYFCELIR